ncbi:MAG: nitric oxide reductase activation protein NorD, partial [Candidatus Competibacterales bacterium]
PAPLPPEAQALLARWRGAVADSDPTLAQRLERRAAAASQAMAHHHLEAWVLAALEAFDQRGLGDAMAVLDRWASFAHGAKELATTTRVATVAGSLRRWLQGLGGADLASAPAPGLPYTDTAKVFLPSTLQADTLEAARAHYRLTAAHHWAQVVGGTWQPELLEQLLRTAPAGGSPGVPDGVLERFAALERLRLDAWLGRIFPGLGRAMAHYPSSPLQGPWRGAAAAVTQPDADPWDSYRRAQTLPNPPPTPRAFHGSFDPATVARARRRLAARGAAAGIVHIDPTAPPPAATEADPPTRPRQRKPTTGQFSAATTGPGAALAQGETEPATAAHPSPGTGADQRLPGDAPWGEGDARAKPYDPHGDRHDNAPQTAPRAADPAATYPEWDYRRQHFRRNYCTVRECPVPPGDAAFVHHTRNRYGALRKATRRAFEALRTGETTAKRQPNGDELDLDAAVDALVERRRGGTGVDEVYRRRRRQGRDVAVMIAVDASGSTRGWVNEAEREALVLLGEALDAVGDRYAIYGFSGRTHGRVEVYPLKTFAETTDDAVLARISGLQPRAYTRLGACLRHLGRRLEEVSARHRLLLVLSDGKPEDYGSYTGRYGVEDTRHALLELRHRGIYPFCITLDREGPSYLPHMYGPANFVCLDEVAKLPRELAHLYRRLTHP